MKTIYLLRHAKAENGALEMQDFDRALTPRGAEDAAALGKLMASNAPSIDWVLCSTAARAKQTWEQLSLQWTHTPPAQFSDKLYLATTGDLLHELHQLDNNCQSFMLVGHNPGLHHLAFTLVGSGEKSLLNELEIQFPTCALAVITVDCDRWEDINPSQGILTQFHYHHAQADRVA